MQVIELIGTLVFGIIIAGMILTFLFQIDYSAVSNGIFEMMNPKEKTTFSELNYSQVLKKVENCWATCNKVTSKTDCGNFLLKEDNLTQDQIQNGLDASFFMDNFSSLNFCSDCNIVLVSSALKTGTISKMYCEYDESKNPIKAVNISN